MAHSEKKGKQSMVNSEQVLQPAYDWFTVHHLLFTKRFALSVIGDSSNTGPHDLSSLLLSNFHLGPVFDLV